MWYYCNVCCWVVTIRNRQTSMWSTSRIFQVRGTIAAQSGGIWWHLTTTIQIYYTSPVLDQRRQWHPTPVLLPGKSHRRRSLVGCSPWGLWESDTTERLHFHFSLSWTGEGHGNPLQCSCLENPRDRAAWWAAVYRVTQGRTRLKWLSSSSPVLDTTYLVFLSKPNSS